jgi:hypothetical protein
MAPIRVSDVSLFSVLSQTAAVLNLGHSYVYGRIGDWYPERNVFQIFIALTAAPRFVILFLTYHLYGSTSLFVFGVLRTLSCGGWVYITSSDSGLMHDVLMIGYIVLNIPWMAGSTLMSKGRGVRRGRYVYGARKL